MWQVRHPGGEPSLPGSPPVSANALYRERKLTVESVKSSLPPLKSPPAQVTHLVFLETTFNTPSHRAVASFFHYVSTSEGQDAAFLPPPLTDTAVMSNDGCQGSEGASKWTDTGSVKTPRTETTDNIIILRTLFRLMRPGESMWLMRGTRHIIPHVLFKTLARGWLVVTASTRRGAVAELRSSVKPFQFTEEEIRAAQEVKYGSTSCFRRVGCVTPCSVSPVFRVSYVSSVSSVLIVSFPAPALSHSCLVTVMSYTCSPPIYCVSLSLASGWIVLSGSCDGVRLRRREKVGRNMNNKKVLFDEAKVTKNQQGPKRDRQRIQVHGRQGQQAEPGTRTGRREKDTEL